MAVRKNGPDQRCFRFWVGGSPSNSHADAVFIYTNEPVVDNDLKGSRTFVWPGMTVSIWVSRDYKKSLRRFLYVGGRHLKVNLFPVATQLSHLVFNCLSNLLLY